MILHELLNLVLLVLQSSVVGTLKLPVPVGHSLSLYPTLSLSNLSLCVNTNSYTYLEQERSRILFPGRRKRFKPPYNNVS